MKLDNRSAVVTGGASGIGRATCLALAEAGARVFIGDLNQANAEGVVADIRAAGGVAEAIPLDVAKDASVAEFAHAVHNKAGKVDIVVNCAGWMETEPFAQDTPDHWDEVVETAAIPQAARLRICSGRSVVSSWRSP